MTDRPKAVLVDDSVSLAAAGTDATDLWSTNTGLPYLVEDHRTVRNPESLIDNDDMDRLWRRTIDAAEEFAQALQRQEQRDDGFAHLATTHYAQLYITLLMFVTKGRTMRAWREALGRNNAHATVIGCPDLAPVNGVNMFVGRHDHVFAAIADALPDGPDIGRVPPVDRSLFAAKFHHVPRFDRFFNIVNRPLSAVAFQFWRRFRKSAGSGTTGTALIFLPSDGIEESFLGLRRAGWRLVLLNPDQVAHVDDAPVDLAQLHDELKPVWADLTESDLGREISQACWSIMWPRLRAGLGRHPHLLGNLRATVETWRRTHGVDGRLPVALSSGLYAPHHRLLDSCLRERGIPVVCTDHGAGMGLGFRHDFTAHRSISFSDHYLAYNTETRDLYAAKRRDRDQQVHVVGSPAIVGQCRAPGLQRWAGRRHLSIVAQRPVLMYVCTLATNNMPIGYGASTDCAYAAFQREAVPALGSFPGDVIVKPYPAYRFADPEQIWQMPLPSNARLAPFGEFRHIRWAADVLVLDLCSSTLAWALAADRPLIYLDNISNPMSERAAEAARDALLYVDCRQDGWQTAFDRYLRMPLADLHRVWHDRGAARVAFDHRFVLGPRGDLVHGLVETMNRCAQSPNVSTGQTVAPRQAA